MHVRDLRYLLLAEPKAKPVTDLHPRVPTELPELDRLIMLLGSRSARTDLVKSVRAELIALCGVYPDAKKAALWKSELRQMRAEMKAEPDPEAL